MALSAPFGLRPGEARPVLLLFGGSALLGAFAVFMSSAAGAIFLDAFGAGALPFLYVGSALLVALAGLLYARLESRIPVHRLLPGTLAALLAGTLAIRVALALGDAGGGDGAGGAEVRWPVVLLAGFGELCASFAPLTFWAMAGRLFDVRQAKRLFGPIGAGEVAATSLGGFALPFIVGRLGTANLLWLCAAGLAGLAGVALYVVRAFPGQFATEEQTAEQKRFKPARASRPRLTDRYVVLMLLFAVLATVTYYFAATAFLVQARSEFPTQDALAGFLGVFTGVLSLISFAGRTVVAGRVMERFGIRASLVLAPLTVALTAAVVVAVGLLPSLGIGTGITGITVGTVGLLFVANSVNRISMEATWDSMYKPAYLVLYQPLPARSRLWLQTVVEGVAAPLAQGLAGLCLLAYRVFVGYDPVGLSAASNVLAVAWGLTAGLVGRTYVAELVGAVARRTLGALEVRGRVRQESSSAAGLEVLERRLRSDEPSDVLYCLELLDGSDYQRLEPALVRLLSHPEPRVRVDALKRIERRKIVGALDATLALLERETVPAVRAAAQGVVGMSETEDAAQRLSAAIDDPEPEVRVAALVAVLRYGGEKGDAEAREKLRAMAYSRVEEDRVLAARAIGEAGVKQLHFAIGALLRDESVLVRRAALTAAGQLDVSDLWPRVVQRLVDPDTMRAAATALIQAGPTAMPFLIAAFGMASTPRAQRLSIVRLCGRIRDEDALELLVRNIDHPDAELRRQVLRALDAVEFRATSEAWTARIQKLVAMEIAAGAWISAAQRDLLGVEGVSLPEHITNTFASELDFARERALLLLSFVYDSKALTRCAGLLLGGDAGRRAYALEILDNLLPHTVKEKLFPLLDDLAPERRLAVLGAAFRQERLAPRERIRALVGRSLEWCHPWTQACWIHAAGTLGLEELRPELEQAVMSPAPLVAETARWAVKILRERDAGVAMGGPTTATTTTMGATSKTGAAG